MKGANCDAVLVDYGVSPEHKAQDILSQSFGVLEWIRANAKQKYIDAHKKGLGGPFAST
jgi:acetyl esterase/lipase